MNTKIKYQRGTDTTIGFIAQQVKEHMPIAVSMQKDIIPDEMRHTFGLFVESDSRCFG